MGLDLTLGVIILLAAFRGWFRGFISQAVRIAGLVAGVYLAEPVRNYAKPYVLPYLPTIPQVLVDRLLWWVAAVVTFVVLVGVATLVIKMTRRPEFPGMPPSSRNDQFAGFMLGAIKGVLVAAFAMAGIQRHLMESLKTVPGALEQVKTSYAAKWNEEYRPVPRIWSSPPVRHLVSYIERMGLNAPGEPSRSPADEAAEGEAPAVRTASRPAEDEIAGAAPRAAQHARAEAERLDPDDQAIANLKAELKKEPSDPK